MTQNEWLAIAPFLIVSGLALLIIVVDLIWPKRPVIVTGAAVVGLVAAMVVTVAAGPIAGLNSPLPLTGQPVFGGAYIQDQLTVFLDLLFMAIALLTILFAPDYLEPRGLPMAEFTATLLFAISGAMLLAGAQDLLILFIGLELLVLPGYMLAGFAKRDGLSTEGAIKYFLLGSFSSAILLFGLAFVFGYTGTTSIKGVADALVSFSNGATIPVGLAMGLALLVTGAAFKIAAVPFHYWTPDAYQGSPTPVTGYLSVGPKVAAFALLLRLFVEALGPIRADWGLIMGILAAITMTVGNLAALGQDNIKRMLAYSSIAHTGYIMVGLTVFAEAADPSVQAAGIQARAVLRGRVHVHEPRRVRLCRRAAATTGRDQPDLHVRGARPAGAPAGRRDDPVPAVAGGHPAHGRLLRQGAARPVGRPGRWLADGAGRDPDAQRGRGRVLLPAGGGHDVHA